MFHRQIADKLTNIINKIRKAKILMQSIASLYCCIYEFLIYLIIMINNNNNNEFLFN